ncbi:MAG: hypothetical protein ACI9Y1_002301 [Lentisphaeria bacterium]|jgi:hypothetical protein
MGKNSFFIGVVFPVTRFQLRRGCENGPGAIAGAAAVRNRGLKWNGKNMKEGVFFRRVLNIFVEKNEVLE